MTPEQTKAEASRLIADKAEMDKLLAEVAELDAKATPGEWRLVGQGEEQSLIQTNHVTRDVWTIPHSIDDLPFIAHARTSLPLLREIVRQQGESLEQLENIMAMFAPENGEMLAKYDGDKSATARLALLEEVMESYREYGDSIAAALAAKETK